MFLVKINLVHALVCQNTNTLIHNPTEGSGTVAKVRYGKVTHFVDFNLDTPEDRQRDEFVAQLKSNRKWQAWVKEKIDEACRASLDRTPRLEG